MRPILLVLLVSYHAFAPYSGAWEMPQGIEANETYKWLAYISRSFILEAFVFLSGYVFTMQIVKKQKFKSLFQVAFSKFKRLIIPCWIFGIVYAAYAILTAVFSIRAFSVSPALRASL